MRFAVSCAAADWSADTRGILRVNPIHIEGNVIAGGASSCDPKSFFHDGAHAAFVDVAHGEDGDSGLADVFFLDVVDVTDSDQDAVFGVHFRRESENIRQFAWTQSRK